MQPGAIGNAAYMTMMTEFDKVDQMRLDFTREREAEAGEGMTSAWFLIVWSLPAFLLIWIFVFAYLYETMRTTDRYLLIGDYYDPVTDSTRSVMESLSKSLKLKTAEQSKPKVSGNAKKDTPSSKGKRSKRS